jgi:hypothetical protein
MEIQMTIDITPIVAVFFDLIVFLIGIDFVWYGYWYMKTHEIKLTLGLLGYLALKLFERGNRKNKSSNHFVNSMFGSMFSMEVAGKYLFFGGIGLIIQGLFPLLTQLFR